MTTHSSILTWKIPWTEEPGWLQSMGSQRVGQDWALTHNYNSLLSMFLTLGLQEEAKSHQFSLNLKAKTVQGLVRPMWNFVVERKWKGTSVLRSAALTSFPEFRKEGRIHSITHNTDAQHRPEIPSKELVPLHIHECKWGPTAIALGSEIANLGIKSDSCKFLWI